MSKPLRLVSLLALAALALVLSHASASAEAKTTESSEQSAEKKIAPESRWLLTERPVPGKLSSLFGIRPDPVKSRRRSRRKKRRFHKGVDFVASRGTLVHAAGPGIVIRAGVMGGYGRVVIVDHGHGLQTRYAHLQRIKTKKGEFLPAGAVLGAVGSSGRTTGPHLHFEVRQDGVALPPEDVLQFELPDCARRARHCDRRSTPNT